MRALRTFASAQERPRLAKAGGSQVPPEPSPPVGHGASLRGPFAVPGAMSPGVGRPSCLIADDN